MRRSTSSGARQVSTIRQSVHNPPSRRLHHRRHHERNFMIAHFQIHNDRSPYRVTRKHTKQLDWSPWKHTNAAHLEEVLAVPERDTVLQVMTAPAKLDAVIASLTTATKEKVSSEHVETLGKDPPSRQLTEKIAFPSNAESSGASGVRTQDSVRLKRGGECGPATEPFQWNWPISVTEGIQCLTRVSCR